MLSIHFEYSLLRVCWGLQGNTQFQNKTGIHTNRNTDPDRAMLCFPETKQKSGFEHKLIKNHSKWHWCYCVTTVWNQMENKLDNSKKSNRTERRQCHPIPAPYSLWKSVKVNVNNIYLALHCHRPHVTQHWLVFLIDFIFLVAAHQRRCWGFRPGAGLSWFLPWRIPQRPVYRVSWSGNLQLLRQLLQLLARHHRRQRHV